jgi:hypothetical protein
MTQLAALRAEAHREFIGVAFGADGSRDGDEPQGLTYIQILADPKLAYLGRQVYEQLRKQFAADPAGTPMAESGEDEQYRIRLEGWADALEIMLEEVLAELESLRVVRSGDAPQQDLI